MQEVLLTMAPLVSEDIFVNYNPPQRDVHQDHPRVPGIELTQHYWTGMFSCLSIQWVFN